MLDPTDGRERLDQSTDIFSYIDHNFARWIVISLDRLLRRLRCGYMKWYRTAAFLPYLEVLG
jgi:hypothetical protein